MRNVWLLAKVQLLAAFGVNRALHARGRRKLGLVALALLIFAALLGLGGSCFAYAYLLLITLGEAGRQLLPLLVLTLLSVLTLVNLLLRSNGTLYNFQDYDLILAMPVRYGEVIGSRLLLVYLENLLYSALVLLPSLAAYGAVYAPPPAFYLTGLSLLPFAPLLPLALGLALGTLVTLLSARARRAAWVEALLAGLLCLFLLLALSDAQNLADQLAAHAAALGRTLAALYPPAYWFALGLHGSWPAAAAFALLSVAALLLAGWGLAAAYPRVQRFAQERRGGKASVQLGEGRSAPSIALYSKEWSRFTASSLYMLNMGIGVLMATALSVAALFVDWAQLDALLAAQGFPGAGSLAAAYAPVLLCLFAAMSCTTAVSLSLEGRSLWIVRCAPVTAAELFGAKAAVNLTLLAPVILLDAPLLALALRPSPLECLGYILLPACFALCSALAGLWVNLALPQLEWTSEVQVIKQSAAVGVNLLVQLALLALILAPLLAAPHLGRAALLACAACAALLSAVLWLTLCRQGARRLARL